MGRLDLLGPNWEAIVKAEFIAAMKQARKEIEEDIILYGDGTVTSLGVLKRE